MKGEANERKERFVKQFWSIRLNDVPAGTLPPEPNMIEFRFVCPGAMLNSAMTVVQYSAMVDDSATQWKRVCINARCNILQFHAFREMLLNIQCCTVVHLLSARPRPNGGLITRQSISWNILYIYGPSFEKCLWYHFYNTLQLRFRSWCNNASVSCYLFRMSWRLWGLRVPGSLLWLHNRQGVSWALPKDKS